MRTQTTHEDEHCLVNVSDHRRPCFLITLAMFRSRVFWDSRLFLASQVLRFCFASEVGSRCGGFGGSPGQTRVCKGEPQGGAGCAGCGPGRPPRASPPPSRAPGRAPIGGGRAGSLRVAGDPSWQLEPSLTRASPQHPLPGAATAAQSRILPPSSRFPPPSSLLRWRAWLASAKPLTTSVSQIPAENWGGMQKQLFLAPSSFEILYYL